MAALFLDTSALVRRYDDSKPAGAMIRTICHPSAGHIIMMSRLACLKVAAAFGRRGRERALTPVERERLWRPFRSHQRDQYVVVPVTEGLVETAEHLVFAHSLRSLDAIHIGAVLAVASHLAPDDITFWTTDRRQARAATAAGLRVTLVA